MDQLIGDVRFATRSLLKARAFSVTVIATLAIGIGVAVAVFNLTAWTLFYSSPFPNADRLYVIGYKDKVTPFTPWRLGVHFEAFKEQTNVFAEFAAARSERVNVVIRGAPSGAHLLSVSYETFRVLGIRPVRGRGFSQEEMIAGSDNVIVITDLYWRQRFNADPEVLGRDAIINGQLCTVVGVLGPNQRLPQGFQAEIYRPLVYKLNPRNVWDPTLQLIGRLRRGVTPEYAQSMLAGATLPPIPEWAADYLSEQQTIIMPLDEVGGKTNSWVLFAAGTLLFVTACLNAMNFMLVRLVGRGSELSIRLAIGGTRYQVARLLLIESAGLAVVAALVVALAVRWLFPPLFVLINQDPAARYVTYLNWGTFTCIAGLTVLASTIIGLLPILRLSRATILDGLKSSSSGTSEGPALSRLRAMMVSLQAAMAVILLAGTGLMARTFQRLHEVDLGFDPNGKVKVWVTFPRGQDVPPKERLQYFERLRQAVALLPGVRAASYGQDALIVGGYYGTAQLLMKDGSFQPVAASFVPPDYLRTAGLTLLRGRFYSERRGDIEAVINETMARVRFGDEDPIGQYFSIRIAPDVKCQVVGIVRDVRHAAKLPAGMHYYVPDWLYPPNTSTLLLQLNRDPGNEFADVVRRAIYKVDPKAIVVNVVSINQIVEYSMLTERYTYTILQGLSAIAVLLAVVGLFSVMAYSVRARTREFGIRLALGAQPGNLHRLVLRQGIAMASIGIILGMLAAFGLTQFMKSLLFETSTYDPPVYLAVVCVMLLAAFAACWLPARRVARVDPMSALRAE